MAEDDLLRLLSQIKERWPHFQISKEDLLRPTRELVFRFYTNCVHEYNEKVSYLTHCSTSCDYNAAELAPEEQLFLQLSKILVRVNRLPFTLSDIYQPTQKGTKNFFTVCTHFRAFIDYLTGEIDLMVNEVFTAKEETDKLVDELEEIVNEIKDNVKTIVKESELKESILEQHKSIMSSYKDTTDARAAREKLFAEKRHQREQLKLQLQNKECEFKCLESKEKKLLEQRVTESEYQNIFHTLETLKSELEMTGNNDENIEQGLELENEALERIAEYSTILSKCDFDLEKVKKLIYTEEEVTAMSSVIEKLQRSEFAAKQQSSKDEQALSTMKECFSSLSCDYKNLKNNYKTDLEKSGRELVRIKNDIEEKIQSSDRLTSSHNDHIKKQEEDLEKLKTAFKSEYIGISQVEKRVVDKFTETLTKFSKA